jgi:hypothetical protein
MVKLMAQRDLTTFNKIGNVETKAASTILPAIAEMGQSIIKQQQEARMIESASNAQLELAKLSYDYQIQYQADPFNQEGLEAYKQKQSDILQGYGQNIMPMFRSQWNQGAKKIEAASNAQIQAWGFKQATQNAQVSLKNTMQASFNEAQLLGESMANEPLSELVASMNLMSTRENLEQYGNQYLGETFTQEMLKTYSQDYVKSFVSGLAKTNPVKALQLMESPAVKDAVSDQQEFMKFREAIESRAIAVNAVARQTEILNTMKRENNLLTSGNTMTYAQLLESTNGMSEPARDYFLSVNGYKKPASSEGAEGEIAKLRTADEKFIFEASIYEMVDRVSRQEEMKPEDVKMVQDKIYEGLRNGALSQAEAVTYIERLAAPYAAAYEDQISKYGIGSGFTNLWKQDAGFHAIKRYLDDIAPVTSKDKKPTPMQTAAHATNKANLYNYYYDELQKVANELGVDLAKVPNRSDKREIYNQAADNAIRRFAEQAAPAMRLLPDVPNYVITKDGASLPVAKGNRNLPATDKLDLQVQTRKFPNGETGKVYSKDGVVQYIDFYEGNQRTRRQLFDGNQLLSTQYFDPKAEKLP